MFYLAIDQHSRQLTVNVRGEDGTILIERQVSTRPDAVLQFLDQLTQLSGEEGYMTILEVCGFNDWLVETLSNHGCRDVVLVCAPKRGRRKTDRRDADKLGEMLWINRDRLRAGERIQGLRRVAIATPEQRGDRRLTTRRCQLGRQRTRVINQVKHLLTNRNLQHNLPTKGIQTQKARQWLAQLPLSEFDRFEMDQLLALWELLNKQIKEVQQMIEKRHNEHLTSPTLSSTPACGAYTALAVASRIGDVKRFPSERSLSNYFGLTPGCRNSGEATQRLGSITKEGSPIVRLLLGQLVTRLLRRDPHMRAWYKQIRARRGAKIARVAVMRRITEIFWRMLTYGEAYRMGSPPRRKQRRRKAMATSTG